MNQGKRNQEDITIKQRRTIAEAVVLIRINCRKEVSFGNGTGKLFNS